MESLQRRPIDRLVAGLSFCVVIFATTYLGTTINGRQAAIFCVGVLIGVTLYHSNFSFPGAWRLFIVEHRSEGIRAHALMLAAGVVLFVPALTAGSFLGIKVNPTIAPISISVLIGAFVSGVGMQLSSRCACGTLYSATGPGSAMGATLVAFIVGSVLATKHMRFWATLPSVGEISLRDTLGPTVATALSWLACGTIVLYTVASERRHHGAVAPLRSDLPRQWWFRGPWSASVGALVLALLNFATLALSGYAWHVTSAFALWGAKALSALGVDVAAWPYWRSAPNATALIAPLSHDVPSVMNVGTMIGAVTACALAGRFAPIWHVPLRPLLGATVGGLLLGYGARIAYGSNIGAYFSGILSTSLHGWLWVVAAFAGSAIGIWMRPRLGLSIEGKFPSENG